MNDVYERYQRKDGREEKRSSDGCFRRRSQGGVVTRMIIHYSLNGEKGTKILDIEDGMELKEPEEIK